MEKIMLNLVALLAVDSSSLYRIFSIICLVLIVLSSLFVIVVVMMQQSNSDGISAISGSSETFYGKNKSKTLESKLKKITIAALVIIGVLCVAYCILGVLPA